MTDPEAAPPPRPPEDGAEDGAKPTSDLRERVQRQRQHIKDQTGRDPLEGGIDD
jgi:hypothetical protein